LELVLVIPSRVVFDEKDVVYDVDDALVHPLNYSRDTADEKEKKGDQNLDSLTKGDCPERFGKKDSKEIIIT